MDRGPKPLRHRVYRPAMATHYFPTDQVHYTWDTAHEPVLTVAQGDTVVYETREVSDGQIGPGSDASVIAGLDWDRVYPLAGPVYVEGAEPGDTLAVEILDVHTKGWGWTAILPGLGLLADDFTEPYLRIFDMTEGDVTYFREDIVIPLNPFMGTMGVCPAQASAQPIMPPGPFGGNMDTRQLVAGTTLYLPVHVPGALFSTGDAHGCQGDGEICVTGLEAPMYAVMRFSLIKGRTIPAPQYRTARSAHPARQLRLVLRHDGRRRRPLCRGAGRDAGDDRAPDRPLRPLRRGRLPALQPRRRPQDLGDRRRRAVRRQRRAARIHLPTERPVGRAWRS